MREWRKEEGRTYAQKWEAMPHALFMDLLSASGEIWAFRFCLPPHPHTSWKRARVSSFSTFLFWLWILFLPQFPTVK